MSDETDLMLKAYREEIDRLFAIAQRLDCFNPTVSGAFTGTPSERIIRQLAALNVPGFGVEQ